MSYFADVFERFGDVDYNKVFRLRSCPLLRHLQVELGHHIKYHWTTSGINFSSGYAIDDRERKKRRGGIAHVCFKKYGKGNNKYLDDYDASKGTSYWMYFDANNLYGGVTSQSLPYGGFKLVNEKDYDWVLKKIVISAHK